MEGDPGTTTISTIAVRSGDTRIVIALLQCRDWLELKVVEVNPCLTQLADTLDEATELRRAHAEVVQKIKSKKSPVSELRDQAETALANQNTSPKVFSAMTESITTVWENVNRHLEARARILDLNVAYHRCAEEFEEYCRCLDDIISSEIPVEIPELRERLDEIKEGQRLCLISLNAALNKGSALLDLLSQIEEQGTLDSRPQHIKLSAQLARVQVERWIEKLHEKRCRIQETIETSKIQIEQCLALTLITADLALLKRLLTDRTEGLLNTVDELGDGSASAQLLLHEHRKMIPEAKDMQEQALKIVRATEDFAAGGHFAGPEALKESFLLLEQAASYLHHIDQREALLQRAIEFFNSAQSALIKLDQLEVQLSTGDLGLGYSQTSQLHSNVSRSIEEVTTPPIDQGYALLSDAPGAQGVKRAVEQIENKKITLSLQCTAHKEENVKANQAYSNFIGKHGVILAFLTSMDEYLKGVRDVGDDLTSAKSYLQIYRKNLNDLQNKGPEINALISTIPGVLELVDHQRAEDVKEKGDSLRELWSGLTLKLERRIRHCSSYTKAHDLGKRLLLDIDNVLKSMDFGDETGAKTLWVGCQQLKAQYDNTCSNFDKDSKEVGTDGGLDLEGARQCLIDLSSEIGKRISETEKRWTSFATESENRQKDRQLWESNMAASNKTVDWVSKLDAQLYPVLNPELHSARQLSNHVEEKLNTVLPEIRRAQQEIQLRIETAEALKTKGDIKGANEGIPTRLKELNGKLHTISADYQVLLEKLLTFFNNLSQVESRVEGLQREQKTMAEAHNLEEALAQLREFDSNQHAINEMLNLCLIENSHINNKIKAQEGMAADSDIRTIDKAVDTLRYNWQRICTTRESELGKQEARCRFDQDIMEADQSLHTLASQLAATRGRYGENLSEAKSTSAAFATFEKTIELLEVRLKDFTRAGQELTGGERGEHIERELQAMKNMWISVREQVLDTRRRIDLAVVFFQLVEEAEEWFKEGNKVLLNIAQASTKVKTPDEAQVLLHEIQVFLKPGEEKQNNRIEEITRLARELYGEDVEDHLKLVKSGSKEMMDSFAQISQNLKAIAERINTPVVELMEIEETPKKLHEDWHSSQVVTQLSSSTFHVENINIRTEQASPIRHVEERQKSPSPPLKKTKYVEEIIQCEAPVFTSLLQNSAVDEGCRFTFECRVAANPAPDISWEKDGIVIANPDYLAKYNDGLCTLTIEETFTEDSAKFTCKAVNFAGIAETSAYLSVRECEPEIELTPSSFVTPLSTVSCQEGDRLELKCQVAGVPLPNVQWFCGDKCLDNEQNLMITFNNGEAILVKDKVTLEDQGQYSCIATNPKGTQTSNAKVMIKKIETSELPIFTLELSNVMARAGQKVVLECSAKGSTVLTWSKDGKQIKESKDIKTSTDGCHTTLTIPEAFLKDAGVYTVTASNKSGSVSTTSQVNVKGILPAESSDTELPSDMETTKPSVQLHLRDQSVFEGKKVRLDCVIIGVPEPEVIWYHNEQPVKESPDFQLTFQGDRCSLIIQEALLEDAGTYRVVALNSMGEASSQCVLNVQAVDKEHQTRKSESSEAIVEVQNKNEGAPKFSHLLTDLLVVAGDTVQFECTVTGQPMPNVSWALNNKELLQSERIHMSQSMDGHCLLKITNVTNDNKGVYTARATNQQGEAKCFSHLTVKTPLTLDSIKPQAEGVTSQPYFTELFADTSVLEGGATKFECIVTGRPTPKIKWLFNDQPVSGKDFLVSTSGNRQVLNMPSVSKTLAGKISCVAENEAGKASCVANLSISGPALQTYLPNIDDLNLDTGVFEMKRAVFMQSESSSHFSSSSGGEPVVKIQSTVSKSEVASHKVGDQPPVQVESHKTAEYKNIDGVESKEEFQSVKTSGVEKSPSGNIKKSSSGFVIGKRKTVPPRFISPMNGCIVDQGADVTLTAIIEGHPTPDVTWTRNGGPIPQDSQASWEKGKASLKLNDVKTQHGGRYTCNAVNEAGTATSSADVVVKKSQFPPVLGRRLQARTAVVGERVALEIEVTGTPTPTVSWSKDGQPIRPTSTAFRIISQGNCHTLVIDKVDHIHTGQYGAVATNSAGESRSTADLLVIDAQPEAGEPKFVFSDLVGVPELNAQPQTVSTLNMDQHGGMVVSESLKSEKHISMKVHKENVSMEEVKDIKKNFSKTESYHKSTDSFSKQTEIQKIIDIPKPTFDASKFDIQKTSLEKIETSLGPFEIPKISDQYEQSKSYESFQFQKQFTPLSFTPVFHETPEPELVKNEDLITDSISTKSSLDFFKSIIKENEDKGFKPFEPKVTKQEFKSSFANVNSSYTKQWKDDVPQTEFHLEPGPPPEMGYIPKTAAPKVKDDMADRVKKLEESQRDLSQFEIPSGGIRIFPTKPQSPISTPSTPVFERKKINLWEGKHEIEEKTIIPEKVKLPFAEPTPYLRPCADVQIRPSSPRPSAEGISMEKMWASKKEDIKFSTTETKPISPAFIYERPKSPLPSADGLAMDRIWGHKQESSSINWPPFQTETKSESKSESYSSQYSFQTTKQASPPREFIPVTPGIIYVAEAHATHKTNPVTSFSKRSDFYESNQSQVVTEKTITPSEAKKLFQQPAIEPPKPKKEFKPIKQQKLPQFDDILIQPGPPPEMGFATPPPKERRQSYVEQIEHELEKDLDKPLSRHLVGAIRTIPPPKREGSVESSKSSHYERSEIKKIEKRSSSFCDESTFKPFPILEPFPFKPEKAKESPTKFATIPRPSKFQKKSTESDYESDLEGSKIKARWTPWDSDTEEPYYRKVKPPSFHQPKRAQSAQPEPPPPSSFSQIPLTFESKNLANKHTKNTEFKSQQIRKIETSQQIIKPGSPPEYVQAKPVSPKTKKHQFQDSGYMADTDEPHKFIRQKSSSFKTEKIETIKKQLPATQVHKDSQFISKQITMPELEPFPFKPAPQSSAPPITVPLASPSKFVKGEFKESDYESDYDTRIPPIWGRGERTFRPVKPHISPAPTTPKGIEPIPPSQIDNPPTFEGPPRPKFEPIDKPLSTILDKKIHRPQPHYFDLKPGSPPKMDFAPPLNAVETSNTMSFAESTANSRRVVSMQQTTRVISYDQKKSTKQSLPVKIIPKGGIKYVSDSETDVKTTVETKAEEKRLQRVEEMRKRFGEKSQSLIDIQPGEPPQFDYAPPRVPAVAATVANKHINEMTSTFKTKAQQFVSDIVTEVKQNGKQESSILQKDEPQVYREESRHSEKGTKCIDPDTGLIYFKYDFGYEFGVLLPGEGGKMAGTKSTKSLTTGKRPGEREDGSIEVKVIHERTTPQEMHKNKHQYKSVKWDPTSESEMSDAEEAKRIFFSQKAPKITIPATPSPISMSPSISPYITPTAHETQGAAQWATTASPTPLTAPIVVNAMLHSEAPKKPPMFITPLRDIAVVSGQTARFECIVQAEPIPNVIWAKNGRLLEPSVSHDIQFRNGVCRLTLPNAYSYDAGTYTCTATNNLGTQNTSSNLQVSGEGRTFISK